MDADGSHCTSNGSVWKDVHFIPLPYSGGYNDGTMYSDKYLPYHTITVDGVEYDAAQCWEIALKGILDLVTVEGSLVPQTERNTTVHNLGDGKALNEPIPSLDDWATWGSYPWYEKAGDPCAINFSASNPCNLVFLQKVIPWFLARAPQLGKIGNFQTFGDDTGSTLVLPPYEGNMSSMRMFLIAARFYKHLLDNNINDKVYTAMKDVNIDYDLYGVKLPDAELTTTELSMSAAGDTKEASFTASAFWTITTDVSWLHVDPASGAAGATIVIKVTAEANTGEERVGNVTIKAGDTELTIPVTQEKYVAPTGATLKDFAKEFVKGLDVWTTTVGKVDANGKHCTDNGNAWENVHFIPIGATTGNSYGTDGNQYDPKYTVWTLKVGDAEYTSAQAWDIAIRGLLNMVTSEGEAGLSAMDDRNKAFTFADNAGFNSAIPSASAGCIWGTYPWYEEDDTHTTVTYNGAAVSEVGLDFMVKVGAWHLVRAFVKTSGNANPLGKIGNYQEFGTASNTLILSGYEGYICPMRELLVLARIYKSLLDNNVDSNVYTYLKDKKFDFDLFGKGVDAEDPNAIKAFAKQYVTILDVWEKTTGTINMLTGETLSDDRDKSVDVENAHYVPSTTTITVNGKTYNTADMLEAAERSYILMRGLDGNSTTAGKGTFPATDTQSKMSSTTVPSTHSYAFQVASFNEAGTTTAGATTGNGGHLRMGSAATADGAACSVKLDILDNFAQRHVNYGITRNGVISNMCGYAASQLAGYYGCFCAQRALVTYAFFFKYMLDNNLEDATGISADTVFRSEEFGDEK